MLCEDLLCTDVVLLIIIIMAETGVETSPAEYGHCGDVVVPHHLKETGCCILKMRLVTKMSSTSNMMFW